MDSPSDAPRAAALADRIDAVLPQTQCTRCGFDGCRPYAEAIAAAEAGIDRCPPGGEAGVVRLAALTGLPVVPLDASRGVPGALRVAWIDASVCIGCTKCLQACPVDAIVGANRRMHTVVADACTGCDLCLAPCPVDCIEMRPALDADGRPRAWTDADAALARERTLRRRSRLARVRAANDERLARKALGKLETMAAQPDDDQTRRKRAIVEAALARARERAAAR